MDVPGLSWTVGAGGSQWPPSSSTSLDCLGVKGSQVQILSSRQLNTQVRGAFPGGHTHRVGPFCELSGESWETILPVHQLDSPARAVSSRSRTATGDRGASASLASNAAHHPSVSPSSSRTTIGSVTCE